MQIIDLNIENFKGVREAVRIPLHPITLLFGANSSGKSTILQALLYLRELLERGNADADALFASGSAIDLGGFRQFVHGHDIDRLVTIGATVVLDDDGLPIYPVSRDMPEAVTSGGVNAPLDNFRSRTAGVAVSVRWSHSDNAARIVRYSVYLDGEEVGHIEPEASQAVSLFVKGGSKLDAYIFPIDDISPDDGAPPSPTQQEASHKRLFAVGSHCVPTFGRAFDNFRLLDLSLPDRGVSEEKILSLLSSIFVGAGEMVLRQLQTIRYLGPVRTMPQRQFNFVRSPAEHRWADGSAAWDLLYGSDREHTWLDLQAVNNLGLGYRLETARRYEVPAEGRLGRTIEQAKLGLVEAFEDLDEVSPAELQSIRETVHFQLVSEETGVEVQPADVGIGVSQALPVVIGAMAPGCSILAVEQPELHLHPRVQCNLADILIRSMNGDPDLLQIHETHSEHLMLRLMRRIRETASGLQPSKALMLRPDQVQVLFVEIYEGRSVFRPMPLDANGEWVKAWPGGFFEEDLEEVL